MGKDILDCLNIQGVPEKMSLSEIGALLTKEHFSGTPGMAEIERMLHGYTLTYAV